MNNPANGHDDELRRLLQDAVSDVHPPDALDRIRSQTDKVVPMNRRWLLPSLAAAVVMAAVIGGAFWMVRDDQSVAGPAGTPSPTPSSMPTPTPTPDATPDASKTPKPEEILVGRAVPVYFVGRTANGSGLYREFQSQRICTADECILNAAIESAIAGKPLDGDYTAPWPDGTRLISWNDQDGLTIDLSGDIHDRPAGMSQSDAELAIQQLIYSAQAGLGRGRVPVQLLLDGKHTDQILGVPASEPLSAGNPDDVLAPVQVDSPTNGAYVSSTITVTGRAATFEANVVWELKQGGTVVKHGFTTAQECCTLAPFRFDVRNVEPGQYTLVVHDTDESGEGRPVNEDTKEITVQ